MPTGSLGLDLALGMGSWPWGRISELFGPEGAGKTTLTLEAIAGVLRHGGRTAFVDADHATGPESAGRFGIDLTTIDHQRTNSLEDALGHIEKVVRAGRTDLVVLDAGEGDQEPARAPPSSRPSSTCASPTAWMSRANSSTPHSPPASCRNAGWRSTLGTSSSG